MVIIFLGGTIIAIAIRLLFSFLEKIIRGTARQVFGHFAEQEVYCDVWCFLDVSEVLRLGLVLAFYETEQHPLLQGATDPGRWEIFVPSS